MFNDLRTPSRPLRTREEAGTNAPSAAIDHWCDSLRKPVTAVLGAVALFGCEPRVNAGLTPDEVDPARALQAGSLYGANKGALHLRYEYDDPTAPTGRRVKYAGAVLAKDNVAFTSAHIIDGGLLDRNLKAWVGTCANYNDAQGPWYEVKSFHMFPGYVNDGSRAFTADIAALTLCTSVTTATPAVMATEPVPEGENVIYSGSGAWGTPSSGLRPRDGNIRAGQSKVHSGSLGGETPEFYQTTVFDNAPDNVDGLRPTAGYSGWPVFINRNGKSECVGLMTYGNTSVWATGAGYLKATHPEVQAFMRSFITPTLNISQTAQGIELRWNADETWQPRVSGDLTEGSWRDLPIPSPSSSNSDRILLIPQSELKDSAFFQLTKTGQ